MVARFWLGVNRAIERGAIDSGAGQLAAATLPVGVNGAIERGAAALLNSARFQGGSLGRWDATAPYKKARATP